MKNSKKEQIPTESKIPKDLKGKKNDNEIDTTESDVTKDDLEALGPKNLSMDGGDDEDLAHRSHPVDFSGNDLDVPGSELDDASEDIGSEDEENNSYSLGNNN